MKQGQGAGIAILLATSLISFLVGCSDEALVLLPDGTVVCQEQQVELEVGEWEMLPAFGAVCLLFAPADARYAIAYYDIRLVEQARTGLEEPWPEPHWFDVVIVEGQLESARSMGESRTTPPLRAESGSLDQPHEICVGAASDEILCRPRPWMPDEEFRVYSDYVHFLTDFAGQTARVVAVSRELVFAVLEQDLTRFRACEWCLGLVDSIGSIAQGDAVPLMKSSYSQTFPVTSSGSSQLLVLLHTRDESQSVGWISGSRFHVLLQVHLSLDLVNPDKQFASRLVHELAHAFQRQYAWERDFVFYHEWAKEGGADLLTSEFLRGQAGIALDANFDAAEAIDLQTWREDPNRFLYALSFQHEGEIASGYQHSSNMLRDFVMRLIEVGEADTIALREVLRGALEGWHGATTAAAEDGLTSRMNQGLGRDWDPVKAVLTWTLSNAVDDRTRNPQFQNPAVFAAWNPEGPRVSWLPSATYELGSRQTLSLSRQIGGTGYLYVLDSGSGGTLVLRSNTVRRLPLGFAGSGVRWALIRYE